MSKPITSEPQPIDYPEVGKSVVTEITNKGTAKLLADYFHERHPEVGSPS